MVFSDRLMIIILYDKLLLTIIIYLFICDMSYRLLFFRTVMILFLYLLLCAILHLSEVLCVVHA